MRAELADLALAQLGPADRSALVAALPALLRLAEELATSDLAA